MIKFGLFSKCALFSLLMMLASFGFAQDSAVSSVQEEDIKALTKAVSDAYKPNNVELAPWEKDIFALAFYKACLQGNPMACSLAPKETVLKSLKRMQSDEWKKSSLGIQVSTMSLVWDINNLFIGKGKAAK